MQNAISKIINDISINTDKKQYTAFIQQLQKDFALSACHLTIDKNTSVLDLVKTVQQELHTLLTHNFDKYLQLLYRVDVSEQIIYSEATQNIEDIAEKATFYILQREWQKVFYRLKME